LLGGNFITSSFKHYVLSSINIDLFSLYSKESNCLFHSNFFFQHQVGSKDPTDIIIEDIVILRDWVF